MATQANETKWGNLIDKIKKANIPITPKLNANVSEYIEKMIVDKTHITKNIPKASEYKVSTISLKANFGVPLNLKEIANIFIEEIEKNEDFYIRGIHYADKIAGDIKRKKKIQDKIANVKLDKNDVRKKRYPYDFGNQITTVISSKYYAQKLNVKIFSNGAMTITGCKNPDEAKNMLNELIDLFKQYSVIFYYDEDIENIQLKGFNITMINGTYDIGFKINMLSLLKVIHDNYGLCVTFEPKNYAGLKISYFWNENLLSENQIGICQCNETKCVVDTKKSVKKRNKCSIITVCVFKSGKCNITGANDFNKIKDAYLFINKLFNDNFNTIYQHSIDILSIKSK